MITALIYQFCETKCLESTPKTVQAKMEIDKKVIAKNGMMALHGYTWCQQAVWDKPAISP